MMSDVKPKRTARESGQREIASGEAMPTATAPAKLPDAPPLAEVVSAGPGAVAEPAPEIVPTAVEPQADSVDDFWLAFVEAQTALARGLEEIVVEAAARTRSGMAAAADAAVTLLGVKTFSEAVEINAALARQGVDAMIEGSARLSEIGNNALSAASRPVLSRFAGTRSGLAG
jgi:hypothetical protein